MKEFAYIHEEGKLPEMLENIPFLENFTAAHLNDILYSSYFIQCEEGESIIVQGQDDARIFILITGQLDVVKNDEVIATLTKSGEVFGEVAAISGEKRIASVVAKNTTLCLVIDQQFLKELKPEASNASYYAALYRFLSHVLADRLRDASGRIARLEKELEDLKAEKIS
jgi:CRP/FNR family transcriptional regulator, cyclic AMP receptor protein